MGGADEVAELFRVIRELTARGVSIIYISHHLDECLEIADRAVVLRDGSIVAQAPMAEVDLKWIVAQMVGRKNPAEIHSEQCPRQYHCKCDR